MRWPRRPAWALWHLSATDRPRADRREDTLMKLNLWQWVGVALLLLGLAWYSLRYFNTPAQ